MTDVNFTLQRDLTISGLLEVPYLPCRCNFPYRHFGRRTHPFDWLLRTVIVLRGQPTSSQNLRAPKVASNSSSSTKLVTWYRIQYVDCRINRTLQDNSV